MSRDTYTGICSLCGKSIYEGDETVGIPVHPGSGTFLGVHKDCYDRAQKVPIAEMSEEERADLDEFIEWVSEIWDGYGKLRTST